MNKTQELGTKSVGKLLLQYSIPSIIAMMVNAIYNVVDRIFIGQYAGEGALAGLTIAFPVMLLLFAFASLMGIGGAALLSISLGKKDMKKANHIFANTLSFGVIINTSILVVVYFNMERILTLVGATPDIMDYASGYLTIIVFGFIFQMMAFILNSFVRTEGYPNLSMIAMITSAVANTILDYIFIARLGLGVEGAAYATILGQFLGFSILLIFYLRGKSVFKIKAKNLIPDLKLGGRILSIGFATFIATLGASVAMMLLNSSLMIYGGVAAVTAMGAINSMFTFFIMPVNGLNQGMLPIIGYNKGANQKDRVYKTLSYGLKAGIIFSTLFFVALQIFPETFISMFIDSGSPTMDVAVYGLRIYFIMLPILSINLIGISFFQGIAEGKLSFIIGILRPIVLFIPLVFIMPNLLGLTGIWMVTPISDGISVLITGIILFRYYKKDTKDIKTIEYKEKARA